MRGGAGPPPQLSWLPPAFEGGPGLRQRRPRRPAEVKPSCGGLGRLGVGRRHPQPLPGQGGQSWVTAAAVRWKGGSASSGRGRRGQVASPFSSRSTSSEAPAEAAPAWCLGVRKAEGRAGVGALGALKWRPVEATVTPAPAGTEDQRWPAWGLFCPWFGGAPEGDVRGVGGRVWTTDLGGVRLARRSLYTGVV